ncbi:hypothetical protein CH251_13095 [Rhodococcus sp. 06-462-5]|uniref:hypothetical protein n=1 Tax=Nocardiaceae TaxID=85025 RepID=UPI000692008A|nr:MULTISPECIES: hypothetical protein [Rhodococcus]OZC74049.1 hypothetical protein CH251_13095 [Rhodococcus sp. 06-462-5]OZE68045.1 hypothetical protein CH270_10055 [Rhodococcus sp. 02-925g]
MDWLAALLVWIAVGARIGRAVVRSASTVRVSIVLAVGFLALAQTLLVDDVARLLEPYVDVPIVIGLCWIGVAAASAAITLTTRPTLDAVQRRRAIAAVVCTGVAAGIASVAFPTVAWTFVLLTLPLIIVTGVGMVDRTPLGRAVALFCIGFCAPGFVAVSVVFGSTPRHSILTAGALLMAAAAVWVLATSWVRARILLWRINNLHRTLTRRFPEVLGEKRSGAPTVLRASDHVSEIMDALYLQVGAGQFDDGVAAPADSGARAGRVAQTVRDPLSDPIMGGHWIAVPSGVSLARWVTMIAFEFGR